MTSTAEKRHLSRVADLGCIVCGQPAEIHHPRDNVGMAQRAPHCDAIPLCPNHHRIGGHGFALHAGQVAFENTFGTEAELLAEVRAELGIKPGELAR
jgi:hypothetical protein